MAHLHEITDTDAHFIIDEKMQISCESEVKKMRCGDHKSELYSFEMPRYFEGHDMALCDVVEVHYNNIHYDSKTRETTQNKSFDEVQGFQVSSKDENIVIFSWLVQSDATQLEGTLNFCLRFACTNESVVEYQKFSDIFEGITVGKSIFNTESMAKEYADILAQWKADIENQFSELPIKTAPYYKTASTSYANAYYVNLLELEPNVLYGFKVEDTSKSNRIYLNVLCENGTAKSIVYAYGYSIIYLTKSGTQLTLRFVGANDNYLYVINISDLSTSSKVAVGIVHNPKYLPTDNTKEYTPTGNYHPATKKYVDDAKTESMTQAHSEFESLFEYASAAGAETMSFIVGGFRVTSNITNENIFTMLTADDTSLLTGYILYNDTKYEVDFATKSVYDNGATIQFPITGLYIEGSVPELRISTTEKTICAPDNGSAEGGGSDAILYVQQTCRKIATEYMYSPLVLYADNASDYENDAAVGDEALDAILRGRQILVRVPNADGGLYTAIFSPVLMYQLPNYANEYLYLFYLRDEKQNIDLSAMGLGVIPMPIYGELKLKLSQEYNECPLI